MAYRNYGPANGFIVDSSSTSDFTTIQSAITAAAASIAAGQATNITIFIKPGTYTENPTLIPNVNLAAFECDAITPNVVIKGKCTYSGAGSVSISGIQLSTNGDFALSVTGNSASGVNLYSCIVVANNADTALNMATSNANSQINYSASGGNIAGATARFFTCSSPGQINFRGSVLNTGNSVTANTASAGAINFLWSDFAGVITTSGTASISSIYSSFFNVVSGTATLTLGGSAPNQSLYNSTIFGNGTAPLVVNCLLVANRISVHSDQNTPITGSGSLSYTDIELQGPGSVIGNPILISTTNQSAIGMSGAWTPTLTGTVAGSTTYNANGQQGIWTRYNNLVLVEGWINISAATGTGNAIVGGLPFAVKQVFTNYAPRGSIDISASGWSLGTGYTSAWFGPAPGTTNAFIIVNGSAKNGANLQMSNAALIIAFSCCYQI